MDLIKKVTSRERVCEEGEERLHREFDTTQVSKKVKVVVGVDCGSTQTRACVIDSENTDNLLEQLGVTYVIPSVSASILDDRNIPKKTNFLYDYMDTSISNLSGNMEAPFHQVRLVRGTKAMDVEEKENRLTSTTQKVVDPTFYYNIFDAIGYALIDKYEGQVPKEVEIVLSVALPPDDNNPKNIQTLQKNLVGFNWKLLEKDVVIKCTISGVFVYTEPEAFIKAYYVLSGEDTPEATLHIEGGGRSIGAEILVNGQTLGSAQKSIDYGGTQLKEMLGRLYVAKYGGRAPREAALESAIRTGFLKRGNDSLDIKELLEESMRVFAAKIVDETRLRVFDQQSKVGFQDLNVISVSGRLFKKGKHELSLASFVAEEFAKLAPSTQFVHLEGNFIPSGLVLTALSEMYETDEAAVEVAPSVESEVPEAQEGSSKDTEDIQISPTNTIIN